MRSPIKKTQIVHVLKDNPFNQALIYIYRESFISFLILPIKNSLPEINNVSDEAPSFRMSLNNFHKLFINIHLDVEKEVNPWMR